LRCAVCYLSFLFKFRFSFFAISACRRQISHKPPNQPNALSERLPPASAPEAGVNGLSLKKPDSAHCHAGAKFPST
jgi:hypothetical protein